MPLSHRDSVKVKQVDAFTSTRGAGNPAGVVLEAEGLTDEQMQYVAREMGLSETAFVLPASQVGADFRVRFFTPRAEVPLCGHATIASFHLLAEEGRVFLHEPVTKLVQQTGVGQLPVELKVDESAVSRIMMTQALPAYRDSALTAAEAADLLGVDAGEIEASELPVQTVSTGGATLMVPVKSLDSVREAAPDLLELAKRNIMAYLFSFQTESSFAMAHARCFAPGLGVPEDPVTGVAAGALGAYLIHNGIVHGNSPVTLKVEQGAEVGRPGEMVIEVHFEDRTVKQIKVGGTAVTTLEAEVYL